MGSKIIHVKDEAYDSLKLEKGLDESFSDVILRLTNNRGKISDSFGKWKMSDKEVKEFSSELKKSWKGFGKK